MRRSACRLALVSIAWPAGLICACGKSKPVNVPKCKDDGELGCLASADFRAGKANGIASKILSGQTVAGVAGNVTLPSAASVRTGATFGVSNTTRGALADCALDGATGCVSTAGFPAINFSLLAPGLLKKNFTLAGVCDVPRSLES